MKRLLSFNRGLLGALAGTMMFAAMPIALAANSVIDNINISPDPFHTEVPGHLDQAKVFIKYSWNSGGNATGEITEVIKDAQDKVVYYWGATEGADNRIANTPGSTEPISLEWNGKANTGTYDGQYVPDGTYTFYVLSHVATPPDTEASKTFEVKKAVAPIVSWVNQPETVYYSGSGNYTVNYALTLNSAKSSKVRLKINGPENNNPQEVVIADIKNADGNYTISWDGKIGGNTAAPGKYTYSLQPEGSIDGFGSLSNDLTGSFTVNSGNAPQPVLSNVTASPNPYNPTSGNISFNYTLADSIGNSTVMAAVYQGNNINSVADWTFNNQSSGNNTVLWDGKDSNKDIVADGSYIFKVWGNDGSSQIVPMQTSFTVTSVNNTPQPNDQCSGFTDVNKSDSDCEAFTYLKGLGSMTGNPDGTLAPGDLLQRDQVAKIILVTFNKFNSASDYCGGNNPFPDVISTSWSFQYICRGVALGMITGYKSGADAGYYRPARAVNRVEFLALLLRNLSDTMPNDDIASYNDVELNQWFTGYARYAKNNDLFSGNNLYPTSSTTRREVAEIIYKLHLLGKI